MIIMSLSYALLGLLNYFPMSGYDLKKIFNDSINFFWAAKTSQIYRELNALEKNGDLVSDVQASNKGPNKRIYRITPQGQAHLAKWLETPPTDLNEDFRNNFLVRIFFSAPVGFATIYPLIQQRLVSYRQELAQLAVVEERLKEYTRRTGNTDNLPYWKIVLSRGRHVTTANIQWAEETLLLLEEQLKKEPQP